MKFTNRALSSSDYSEINQTNPLRWYIMGRDTTGGWRHQSGQFKCKDFLNEIVSKYQGHTFCVYGFDTKNMVFEDVGVYLRLTGLVAMEAFKANIGSINAWAAKDGLPPLVIEDVSEDGKECILLMPKVYFSNTYTCSFVAYLIRVANVSTVVEDWTKHPTKAVDNPYAKYFDKAMKQGFKPPVPGYWFYLMKDHTKLSNPMAYHVHDNGVYSWFNCLAMEGM
jgi:hypothetical protein